MTGWKRTAALLALAVNLGLATSYVAIWARDQADTPRRHGDFAAFYTAWTMVRAGEGAHLYDFAAQERHQRAILTDRAFPAGLLPYLNPPHAALLLAPLAALSIERAALLWAVVQLGLLVWLLRICRRLWRGRPALERALLLGAVLAAPPLLLTFELGTFSLVVLVALMKLHEALGASRERAAGAWLALGAVKPQLVFLPAVALLAGRRWRALTAAAVVVVALAIPCTALFGAGVWPGFVRTLRAVHGDFEELGIHPVAMYNLKGAVLLAFGPALREVAPAIAVAGLVLGVAATAWIWRGPFRPADPHLDLQLAATVLLGMFTNLHLYPQDGLLLVAAALLFDSYLARAGRPRTAFAAVALAAPALWFATELLGAARVVRVPVLLALVLGAWMARELRRPQRDQAPAEEPRRSPT